MATGEKISKDEAIQILTMYRDLAEDATTKADYQRILTEAGDTVGYAPAFRCLVKGLEPEQSIRWKE